MMRPFSLLQPLLQAPGSRRMINPPLILKEQTGSTLQEATNDLALAGIGNYTELFFSPINFVCVPKNLSVVALSKDHY